MSDLLAEPIETIGVVSLNMLLDKTRTEKGLVEPQYKRIESLARTLGSLPVSLDVVLLQEAHVTDEHDNVNRLADLLGLEYRAFFHHNRNGEHLAVMGHKVEKAEPFDIGDRRIAVATWAGEVACYNVHNRSGGIERWPLREEQMKTIVDRANCDGAQKTLIAGDTNDLSLSPSRQLLKAEGFTSVYKMKGSISCLPGWLPRTYPTSNYREIMWNAKKRRSIPFGVSIDTIDVRGFKRRDVVRAGTAMTQKSDHKVVWAELIV